MSDPDRVPPEDQAAAYALGALSPEEARDFELFLAASPETAREVAAYREVTALLALAGPGEAAPDPTLRERVLGAARKAAAPPIAPIAPPGAVSPRGIGRLAPWLGMAACLAAAVWLGTSRAELARTLAARDTALVARDAQLARREATLDAILEPTVQLYQLTAPGGAQPAIQLFMDPRRHVAIAHAVRLPPAPPGRTYQLWFIPAGANAHPIPSRTFDAEPSGRALVERIEVPADRALTAAAVTEEPAGGSPQPTTRPILVGSLERPS